MAPTPGGERCGGQRSPQHGRRYRRGYGTDFSTVGQALAAPARSAIVDALMDGSARPAGELAAIAGVGASTASEHLTVLVDTGLVREPDLGRGQAAGQGTHRPSRRPRAGLPNQPDPSRRRRPDHHGGRDRVGMELGFHLLRRAGYTEDLIGEVARVAGYVDAYKLYCDDRETV
jgi:DNA-binding transcriptional ArsR family regulator